MRFIDEVKIHCAGGHGGAGCTSFRREKYVARGGPNGGDGGKGGSVEFIASSQLSTLQDFRFRRFYRAKDGRPGQGSMKTGHGGENLILQMDMKESNF